ncbi:small ribosomal subunit protein mS40 [Stomoxys calcitrans]|uniref:Small ribosomal subunit protein mS40 n=1 Tax=Stomoxys calcitrans TaxID=35570 RepID=A0A1I8NN83_STOCA|nr:small ribosomal subunit protein mS40 [Stomoxys calcitrans]
MIKFGHGLGSIFKRIALNHTGASLYVTQPIHTARALNCENHKHTDEGIPPSDENQEQKREPNEQDLKLMRKDRTKVIPVETSIRYLTSSAYKQTYGEHFVWEQYRRNHKGPFPPRKTRKTCIRQGHISTGNPCPICRDEYLVLDHRNIELLKQFISPQTGQVLSYTKTGLCQKKHLQLLVAVERAWDYGLLTFDVPYREFDYTEYAQKSQA